MAKLRAVECREFIKAVIEKADEMGVGPAYAIPDLLKKTNLTVADIDLWEINEAFSIVALNCIKELGLDPDKLNPATC